MTKHHSYAFNASDNRGALVGAYETMSEAEEAKDIEVLCWSDEGLGYFILPAGNCDDVHLVEYEALCERCSK